MRLFYILVIQRNTVLPQKIFSQKAQTFVIWKYL